MFTVPGILVSTIQDLEKQVNSVKGMLEWLHLDVMDGKFVESNNLALVSIPDNIFTDFSVEAHLMVEKPLEYMNECKRLGIQRVIVHYEAIHDTPDVLSKIKELGFQLSVALNPGTTPSFLENVIEDLDAVLLMTVQPGKQGQKFISKVLDKIQEIRLIAPDALMGIDGGVKLENLIEIKKYNLDYIVVGSGLWQADDVTEELKKFQQS